MPFLYAADEILRTKMARQELFKLYIISHLTKVSMNYKELLQVSRNSKCYFNRSDVNSRYTTMANFLDRDNTLSPQIYECFLILTLLGYISFSALM